MLIQSELFLNMLQIQLKFQNSMKNHQEGLDWYSLSKINTNAFNLQSFYKIINQAHLKPTHLQNIPETYRQKLLLLFQTANIQTTIQSNHFHQENNTLIYRKKVILEEQKKLQGALSQSLAEITVKKQAISHKIKTIKKLKQKIAKSKQRGTQIQNNQTTKQLYYCPFCTINNFQNRQEFTSHVFAHQASKSNNSESNNEWKEFILTLKDKEMQIMEMLLKQKKEADRQDLQRLYKNQLNQFINMGNQTERTNEQGNIQLAGESSYFYQNNKSYKMQPKSTESQWKRQEQQKYFNCPSLNNKEQHYYEEESVEQINVEQIINQSKKEKCLKQQVYRFQPAEQNIKNIPNSYNPLYLQESKQHSYNNYHLQYSQSYKNQSKLVHPKDVVKSTVFQQTIYSDKKKYNQQIYIFNSGKLIQDPNPGDSDYDDYFQPTPVSLKIDVRQQIINVDYQKILKKKPYHDIGKLGDPVTPNQSESCIIDLSEDSFSKRNDNSLSKDLSDINLSDLKLSKLDQFKKDKQFHNFSNNKQQIKRIQKASEPNFNQVANYKKDSRSSNVLQQFTKQTVGTKYEQNCMIIRQIQEVQSGSGNIMNKSSVLNQFMKQPVKHVENDNVRKVIDLKEYLLT